VYVESGKVFLQASNSSIILKLIIVGFSNSSIITLCLLFSCHITGEELDLSCTLKRDSVYQLVEKHWDRLLLASQLKSKSVGSFAGLQIR
jgi:hypothetical protein